MPNRFCHCREKQQQLNESLNICLLFQPSWKKLSLNIHVAQCSNARCVDIQTVRSSSECLLFVNASSQDLYLQTVCLTVCAKEKAQMCVNSQGL